MYQKNEYFSSIKFIQRRLQEEYGLRIKEWRLGHILRHHLNMKYKKVHEVSWQANSDKNRILRQQFGLAFLRLDLAKKIIINVDESWLNMTDFRRRKWSFLGRSDSKPQKQMQPRISLIVGLDTNGSLYLSLLQCNNNSDTMIMFFGRLLEQLDSERPSWRQDTVIMIDGAPYHQSGQKMDFFEEHQVPILFTGPHSYDASPIELFFAAFKSVDINPD